ncbi:hypothetical protein D9M70_189150 [compost metagenome]
MSTAPREPKNGQTRATTIRPRMTQRWVEGRVRKFAVPLDMLGSLGAEAQAPCTLSRISCQKNMATAHAAMVSRVAVLAPVTTRPTPTTLSFRPRMG